MSGLEFETTSTQSFLLASSSRWSSSPSSWKYGMPRSEAWRMNCSRPKPSSSAAFPLDISPWKSNRRFRRSLTRAKPPRTASSSRHAASLLEEATHVPPGRRNSASGNLRVRSTKWRNSRPRFLRCGTSQALSRESLYRDHDSIGGSCLDRACRQFHRSYVGSVFGRTGRFDQFSILSPLKRARSLSFVVASTSPFT